MRIVSGFYVYRAYISYKSHFNQKGSDISKYNFNLFKVSYTSFLNTKGQNFYDKIAKRLQKEPEVINVFISAFMTDSSLWIGDICNELSYYIELNENRQNRINNMAYIFRRDCITLLNAGLKFDTSLGILAFNKFISSEIELESFIIFKKIFNFNLDNNKEYCYFYRDKYLKYECLLNVDIEKYKQTLKECVLSNE